MIGLRGAITVNSDTVEEVKRSTVLLMKALMEKNNLVEENIISIFFTATKDIHSSYPGKHLREELNLRKVAMLHFQEMDVEGSLPLCIRVLIHYDGSNEPNHQYLKGAEVLRPDWMK